MDWLSLVYGLGLLQGLILALILFLAPSTHRLANCLMGGLVLVIALALLQSLLIRLDYYYQHPDFALLIPPLDFVWGPLLYVYSTVLIRARIGRHQFLHFLPALLILLGANLAFATNSTEIKQAFVQYLFSTRRDPQLEAIFLDIAPAFWRYWVDLHLHSSFFVLQFGTYCVLVLRLIREHNRRLQQHFSSVEKINLRWLYQLTIASVAFLVVFLIFNRAQLVLVGHFDFNAPAPSAPQVVVVALIYLIAFRAIFQSDLVRGVEDAQASTTQPYPSSQATQGLDSDECNQTPEADSIGGESEKGQTPQKYTRSEISIEDASRFKKQLMQAIEEEKLYLDSELTLPDLARHAGLRPHQVSQVLNHQMNQNFFSFVNNYRIQLAKKMLSEPETARMPIVELAVEVGFKSKSSFYDAFKKATQLTPTQYKKSLIQ